jgi:hypothetical protein
MKKYPLDRRLSVPQSRSGICGVEKNLLPLPGIEPCLPIPYLVAIALKRPTPPLTEEEAHCLIA